MSTIKHYIVGTGDGADFATISAAMDVVSDGDVVSLQPGLYEELIHIHADITLNVVTNTNVVIESENNTLTDDNSVNTSASPINADETMSNNLSVNANADYTKSSISMSTKTAEQSQTEKCKSLQAWQINSQVESVASKLETNEAVISNGMIISANATLQYLNIAGRVDVRAGHVCIEYCEIHHGKDGVRVWESAALTLQHSRIHHCNDDGDGVYFMPQSSGDVVNCDLYECRVNGIHARHARVSLMDSRIRDCRFGVYFCDHASGLVQHNTIEHIIRFGVYITEGSEPVIQGNTISECGIHTVMVSHNGNGLISDNSLKGSMHVCDECHARLGENRITGTLDVDTSNVSTTTTTTIGTTVGTNNMSATKTSTSQALGIK